VAVDTGAADAADEASGIDRAPVTLGVVRIARMAPLTADEAANRRDGRVRTREGSVRAREGRPRGERGSHITRTRQTCPAGGSMSG
jgi:hypothetical protein